MVPLSSFTLQIMDTAASGLCGDTGRTREDEALFCPNERDSADQGVKRKVLRDRTV
jgi:hypothetical protein